jgi:hypothetical protein
MKQSGTTYTEIASDFQLWIMHPFSCRERLQEGCDELFKIERRCAGPLLIIFLDTYGALHFESGKKNSIGSHPSCYRPIPPLQVNGRFVVFIPFMRALAVPRAASLKILQFLSIIDPTPEVSAHLLNRRNLHHHPSKLL